MPTLRQTRPRRRLSRAGRPTEPRIVVVGDLVLDVVLAPAVPLEVGSDVPGKVTLTQGGSAANTARWLGRLGARASLVGAVGRDATGRALVEALRADGVTPRIVRVAGERTGRIGVFVTPGGERSFVQDRAAALRLSAADLRPAWFAGASLVHVPMYSLLGEPLGSAGRRAIELGRATGALISSDLSSIGPLLADGLTPARALVRGIGADLLFANASESAALLGTRRPEGLLEYAAIAVVKRGGQGVTVLARGADGEPALRFEVATRSVDVADTTGAGDAFTAGFLVGWFAAKATGHATAASLQRAALTGHRAAARQVTTPRPELSIG